MSTATYSQAKVIRDTRAELKKVSFKAAKPFGIADLPLMVHHPEDHAKYVRICAFFVEKLLYSSDKEAGTRLDIWQLNSIIADAVFGKDLKFDAKEVFHQLSGIFDTNKAPCKRLMKFYADSRIANVRKFLETFMWDAKFLETFLRINDKNEKSLDSQLLFHSAIFALELHGVLERHFIEDKIPASESLQEGTDAKAL